MRMKSVKLDEEAYKVAQEGKAAGGFASISAFLKHVFNLVGLSTFEPVNESQERREMRQKLDELRTELHEFFQFMRDELAPGVKVDGQSIELKVPGPELRALMVIDKKGVTDFKYFRKILLHLGDKNR